jgi:hypothetical protein
MYTGKGRPRYLEYKLHGRKTYNKGTKSAKLVTRKKITR